MTLHFYRFLGSSWGGIADKESCYSFLRFFFKGGIYFPPPPPTHSHPPKKNPSLKYDREFVGISPLFFTALYLSTNIRFLGGGGEGSYFSFFKGKNFHPPSSCQSPHTRRPIRPIPISLKPIERKRN